jgi:hypothetical protein
MCAASLKIPEFSPVVAILYISAEFPHGGVCKLIVVIVIRSIIGSSREVNR